MKINTYRIVELNIIPCGKIKQYRGMAQLASAHGLGP
ncbi:MAG: hypothetical protein ACD_24C00491G0003 [uncultured bacterium]|nr:MAG: hypothetical protein ACD_24C00491G0003 [uncultured bacterium]